MALTAYCKKCGKEVDPGERCPVCGSRLGKTAAHAVWCLERVPVRDWISWNAVMRVLLPAGLAVVIMVLLLEGISGGPDAVEQLLRSGFLTTLAILLGTAVLLVFVVLLLRGPELADFVIDNRGVHETRYLPNPTPLKLLVRGKSPALARDTEEAVLRLSIREISWKDVARIQLWPEKCMVLVYAPSRWLRVAVVCTPFTWDDVMGLIRNKLGRKKKVLLPASLVVSAPPARRKAKPQAQLVPEIEEAIEQLRMEERTEEEASRAEPPETEPSVE